MNARNLVQNPLLLLLPLLLVVAACDSDDPSPSEDDIRHGVNFTRLFAEPTSNEIAAVRAEWSGRETAVSDVEVQTAQTDDAIFHMVSHTMTDARTEQSFTHCGLVRFRAGIAHVGMDVLLVHHGGDNGTSVDEVVGLSQLYSDLFENTIQVVPAYRSESIRGNAAIGLDDCDSGGNESPWDHDVDDAMALYEAVREEFPTETGDQVASLSFSRGAGVALLQAVRDERILGVTEYFGPTDFFDLTIQALAERLLAGDQEVLAVPGAPYLLEEILLPLQGEDGEYNPDADYDGARLEALRRSPAYFTPSLPAVQIHHHVRDKVVPFRQGLRLNEMLVVAPNDGVVDNDYNRYENELGEDENGHDPGHLPDAHSADTEQFLSEVYAGQAALVAAH